VIEEANVVEEAGRVIRTDPLKRGSVVGAIS
jgi:hypothetical protein